MPEELTDAEAYAHDQNKQRREKDEYFGSAPDSPIPASERRSGFAGLTYYPPNPAFRVEAQVKPFGDPEIIQLATTTGHIRPQIRYGELRFSVNGQELRLTGFLDPDYAQQHHGHQHGVELFVPFRDATSGKETYGAGRYIEVMVEEADDGAQVALVDFNLAYSPYCAYNEAYSCPLPPAENTLRAPIEAGEKTYH
jgi:uncharacterized protein (DUF1684 family)